LKPVVCHRQGDGRTGLDVKQIWGFPCYPVKVGAMADDAWRAPLFYEKADLVKARLGGFLAKTLVVSALASIRTLVRQSWASVQAGVRVWVGAAISPAGSVSRPERGGAVARTRRV